VYLLLVVQDRDSPMSVANSATNRYIDIEVCVIPVHTALTSTLPVLGRGLWVPPKTTSYGRQSAHR